MVVPPSAQVWRKYNTDGVPGSGPHQPNKDEIIAWAASLEALVEEAADIPPPNPLFLLQNFR